MHIEPINNSTKVRIHTEDPNIGTLRLWVPETIASNTGFSAVYPVGTWHEDDGAFEQRVSAEGLIGPGSYRRVDENTLESLGRRIPADNPVEWRTRVSTKECDVHFTLSLRNLGDSVICKAGAAICLRFLDAPWWSIENSFVSSQGKPWSLAELDTNGQEPREYQAYLVNGKSYDNIIYREGWCFSRHRVDKPFILSQDPDSKAGVIIYTENGYFFHRNKGNL